MRKRRNGEENFYAFFCECVLFAFQYSDLLFHLVEFAWNASWEIRRPSVSNWKIDSEHENIVLVLRRRLLLLRIYHCELDWLLRLLLLLLSTAAMAVDGFLGRLGMLTTSDHASVVSMNLFVALLCACILIGHLLEENRWINESITALAIVSICVFICIYARGYVCIDVCLYVCVRAACVCY
jgi:hypothetical protein